MNYLAHAYLSFEDPEVLTGNMISDFVKGKSKFDYPHRVKEGIELHRAIDSFTDESPVTKSAAQLFRKTYGLYALAFMDIVYDHFLARELAERENNFFKRFVETTYERIATHEAILPEKFSTLFPYMRHDNWLFNYQFVWGAGKSFGGLVQRAKYLQESDSALVILEENYDRLKNAYDEFFPALLDFSLRKFADIH